jgi:hypothetical protein
VRALARSAADIAISNPNLEKIRGDALKAEDVEAALIEVDVVIQTLGVGLGDLFRPVYLFSDATQVLIVAMRGQGVERLICVTGFGAGDSRASISCLQRLPFEIVLGRAYSPIYSRRHGRSRVGGVWTSVMATRCASCDWDSRRG